MPGPLLPGEKHRARRQADVPADRAGALEERPVAHHHRARARGRAGRVVDRQPAAAHGRAARVRARPGQREAARARLGQGAARAVVRAAVGNRAVERRAPAEAAHAQVLAAQEDRARPGDGLAPAGGVAGLARDRAEGRAVARQPADVEHAAGREVHEGVPAAAVAHEAQEPARRPADRAAAQQDAGGPGAGRVREIRPASRGPAHGAAVVADNGGPGARRVLKGRAAPRLAARDGRRR